MRVEVVSPLPVFVGLKWLLWLCRRNFDIQGDRRQGIATTTTTTYNMSHLILFLLKVEIVNRLTKTIATCVSFRDYKPTEVTAYRRRPGRNEGRHRLSRLCRRLLIFFYFQPDPWLQHQSTVTTTSHYVLLLRTTTFLSSLSLRLLLLLRPPPSHQLKAIILRI